VAGRAFDDFGMLGFIGEFILPSGHAGSEAGSDSETDSIFCNTLSYQTS